LHDLKIIVSAVVVVVVVVVMLYCSWGLSCRRWVLSYRRRRLSCRRRWLRVEVRLRVRKWIIKAIRTDIKLSVVF
jgi:hypothetical protein